MLNRRDVVLAISLGISGGVMRFIFPPRPIVHRPVPCGRRRCLGPNRTDLEAGLKPPPRPLPDGSTTPRIFPFHITLRRACSVNVTTFTVWTSNVASKLRAS